jgi:hypothetical protein
MPMVEGESSIDAVFTMAAIDRTGGSPIPEQ